MAHMAKNTTSEGGEQVYELGYLVLPSIAEDQLAEVVGKIKEALTKVGGKELEGENPLKIDLSYTMSKTIGASRYVVSDAYLGWLKFELEPAQTLTLKAEVEKIQELLRFLIMKVPRETNFTFAEARALLAESEKGEGESTDVAEVSPVVEPVVE